MTAHVVGLPLEELLVPLLSTGGVLLVALRARLAAVRLVPRRDRTAAGCDRSAVEASQGPSAGGPAGVRRDRAAAGRGRSASAGR